MEMKVPEQQKPCFSVLQGDRFFFNKILSRKSLEGQAPHVYYHYRSAEGVPFKWEMQPGIPKINNPPPLGGEDAVIPLPSPSPLMQSLLLPKPPCPCSPKSHSGLKAWLRKTMKKIKGSCKIFQSRKQAQLSRSDSYVKLLSSSCNSYSSSSDHFLDWDLVDSTPQCKPWKVSNIIVRATRENLMN